MSVPSMTELLLRYLQRERDHLVASLDGLGEYDVRRPVTPTGTNLLGLVKHVASVEIGYFGDCVGQPWPEPLPWDTEAGRQQSLDMYAAAEESRETILDLYRRAWETSDATIRELGLDHPAHVPWWLPERRDTTVGYLLVHMLDETAHHAGHADVVRESIDGRGGRDQGQLDAEQWREFVARIREAADAHR